MEHIQLAIIEDQPVIRKSLKNYFEVHPSITVEVIAISVEDFLEQISELISPKLDLLLLDIGLSGMSGIEGIPPIKDVFPKIDIVMLTTFEDDDNIFNALRAGACSYISKRTSLAKIQEALFVVHHGGSYMSPSIARKISNYFLPKLKKKTIELTPRQNEIIDALVDGLSYKMIAANLGISIDTVRFHIKNIYRLLNVNSKAEIIRKSLNGDI